jgi:arylsulfatase A-like enzyme
LTDKPEEILRDFTYSYHYNKLDSAAIRSRTWKLIYYWANKKDSRLYDLIEDSDEKNNLVYTEKQKLGELASLLDAQAETDKQFVLNTSDSSSNSFR